MSRSNEKNQKERKVGRNNTSLSVGDWKEDVRLLAVRWIRFKWDTNLHIETAGKRSIPQLSFLPDLPVDTVISAIFWQLRGFPEFTGQSFAGSSWTRETWDRVFNDILAASFFFNNNERHVRELDRAQWKEYLQRETAAIWVFSVNFIEKLAN